MPQGKRLVFHAFHHRRTLVLQMLKDPQVVAALIGFVGSILGGMAGVLAGAAIERWKSRSRMQDHFIFWIWRMAFDRPAFRDRHEQERNQADFLTAIEHTIQAVENGIVMSHGGVVLNEGFGLENINNHFQKSEMRHVLHVLNQIAAWQKDFISGTGNSFDKDRLQRSINNHRNSILITMNKIWSNYGIPNLPYIR
jgi:hypothetical protein